MSHYKANVLLQGKCLTARQMFYYKGNVLLQGKCLIIRQVSYCKANALLQGKCLDYNPKKMIINSLFGTDNGPVKWKPACSSWPSRACWP
eukprot:1159999-Pelagomonas_calceolata.AAC.3